MASLDICIAMDCTGSMSSFISTAKDQIKHFVSSLGTVYPNIPLRIAFVGYRDYCDGDNRLAVFPFSSSIDDFKAFVSKQVATGGGDEAEDVFG
jgi:hypothetical protein